jgi:phage gp29-like protein
LTPALVDHRGQPLRKEVLTEEIAGPTLAGVRSPISGYPADGMNPVRLANILRAADQGDPLAYFELAEQIEERDPHYLGVLSTRKRSVSQIDVTVVAASDEQEDVELADMVRDWLDRDELVDETFDILDATGKGVSYTEIIWDFSEGQYRPDRLEWRDPRFFTFDARDGRTPFLRGGEDGRSADSALAPFKFISHNVKAKSGLPVRSGIARVAAWSWMFKAFTQRDWAVFAQTYGQPIRIGKFDSSASKADKATLWRAVANIAGDCAAIIPSGMEIDFVQAPNLGAAADLYEKRADWLDRQISKLVVGQTGTTDSKSGGLGDGGNKVHDGVREDIEVADCKGLAATLNRDLVRPWVDLERGPRPRGKYPRIKIERPKPEDLTRLASALAQLVPLGLRVQQSEIRDKFGLADPDKDADLLHPEITSPVGTIALQSQQLPTAPVASPADQIADRMVTDALPSIDEWFGTLRSMMAAATDLTELREMVRSAYPQLDASQIAKMLGTGFTAARAAGASDVEDVSGR